MNSLLSTRSIGRARLIAIVTATALVAGPQVAPSADFTWGGGTGNWTDVNWNPGPVGGPTTAGNTATVSSGNVTVNVGGPGNLDSITLGSGGQMNLSNAAYGFFGNLILQGGTVSGSGNYNAYGAAIFGDVTVSGSAASTITGGSWFNINPVTTFTVADATGSSATDLLVSTSLRGPAGSPDTNYNPAKLIKEGAGTMEVTVHSYFRGGLDLNGGTLKLSGGNSGYGFFDGTVTINDGTTLTIDSDGTGFGWQNGWKPTSVNILGGTVNGGGNHLWGISGGVNMTGGTFESTGFTWNFTNLNTNASVDTATLAGPINLRADGGYTTMAVSVADGAAATDLLISGNISEQFGSVGITKSGAGTMTLTGNSTYTGGTTVNEGTLILSSPNFDQSAIRGSLTVNSGATVTVAGLEYAGLGRQGTYVSTLNVVGGVVNNTVQSWLSANVNLTAGTLAGSTGSRFQIINANFNSLASATTSVISADLLIRKDFGSSNPVFNVQDGAAATDLLVSGAITEVLSAGITKSGAGKLVLAGTSTYTGPTSVSQGTLAVNGTLGNTAVTVDSGATLGGSGSIAGTATVDGILSPGNSPGVITLGSLVLGGTSTTLIEITGTSRGSAYDGVDITTSSGLTYGGLLSLDFSLLPSAVADNTTFNIFSFLGSPSGDFSSVTSTGLYSGTWTGIGGGNFQLVSGGQTLTFSQASGDIVVVPEPGVAVLGGFGLVGLFGLLRRRRR